MRQSVLLHIPSKCLPALLTIFLVKVVRIHALPIPNTLPSRALQSQITWSNCSESDAPGIQCGSIDVPLDYEYPDGETIQLGMVRYSMSSPSSLGTLVYNPGGPGDVASGYILEQAEGVPNFSSDLLNAYDIVGLDPRGVGLSQAIRCDPDIFNERVSIFPTTDEGYQKLVAHNEALGKSCAELSGSLFYHLDTINVAKDLELVRLALDDGAKLNLLGRSYGSQIGTTYAELYPDNINRMALDGIVDHTQSETSTLNVEATTFEATLDQFFSWCNTTTDCALRGQPAGSIFENTVRAAESQPLLAPGCTSTGENACRSDVTWEEFIQNVQNYILFQNATAGYTGWDFLSLAIAQAAQGNATLLSTPLATSDVSWQYPGLAIGCQDWSHKSNSVADLLYKQHLTSITAPHTRGMTQSYYYQTSCLGWPAKTTNPQRTFSSSVDRAPPMLLVNAQYDPSTSIVWATGIKDAFKQSVLVTRVGAGHTSYQLMGEAAAVIDEFLINGVLPEAGTYVYS